MRSRANLRTTSRNILSSSLRRVRGAAAEEIAVAVGICSQSTWRYYLTQWPVPSSRTNSLREFSRASTVSSPSCVYSPIACRRIPTRLLCFSLIRRSASDDSRSGRGIAPAQDLVCRVVGRMPGENRGEEPGPERVHHGHGGLDRKSVV